LFAREHKQLPSSRFNLAPLSDCRIVMGRSVLLLYGVLAASLEPFNL